MRRSRLRDLASSAGLAGDDLERERLRAERDSNRFASSMDAVKSLVPGIAGVVKQVDDQKRADVKEKTAADLAAEERAFTRSEKTRLEGRDDSIRREKYAHEDTTNGAAANAKAAAENVKATAAAEAAKVARADAIDKESARDNLEGFKREDAAKNNAEKNAIEREKIAAKGKGPHVPTQKEIDEDTLRKQRIVAGTRDAAKDAAAPLEKKKAATTEVENFVVNIKDNIKALKAQIDDKGTYELGGSHDKDLERRMTNIATDLAKLADPGSVAREGEVALAKKGLFPTEGMGALLTRDSTAIQILDNLEKEVEQRRKRAYEVRGLNPAGADDPFADVR